MTGSELSRRRFMQLAAIASVAATAGAARAAIAPGIVSALGLDTYDDGNRSVPGGLVGDPERIVVIGAGFAGLAVANALGSAGVDCVVIEGRDRIGGRAHTVDLGGSPVDLGCSWITEPIGNPMTTFALAAGVLQINATVELDVPTSRFFDARTGVVLPTGTAAAVAHAVRFSDLEASGISAELGPGASTKDGILTYLDRHTLSGDARRRAEYFMRLLTEVPDATDWEKDSLQWWSSYDSPYFGFGQGNFPVGGYGRLVRSLGIGADVRLGHRVTRVTLRPSGVRVHALDAGGKPVVFDGSHAVVTAPLGVLKAGSIGFTPALPAWKLGAIERLGFGVFEKAFLRFPEPYWLRDGHTNIFHLSHPDPMRFPLIVDYFHIEGIPVLAGFNVGSPATALAGLSDAEVVARMLEVLRTVHGGPIPAPTDVAVTRWLGDPYSRGAYSFLPLGSSPSDQDALGEPVGGRILFAGEASSRTRFGYADGALTTGIREAKRLLRAPSVTLTAG